MTGYSTYMKFKRLEEEVTALGLEMVGSKYNGQTLSVAGTYGNDNITIRIPEDPTSYALWPIYSRGVQLTEGSLDHLITWLSGFKAHQNYMNMLGMDKQIKKAEDRVAGGVIMRRLKGEPEPDERDALNALFRKAAYGKP
jgi:hypothetical protein